MWVEGETGGMEAAGSGQEKEDAYRRAGQRICAMLEGEDDVVAKMATVSSVLAEEFEAFFWTGFYRMEDGGLVVGPYQGTPGCLRIAMDRGVCGAAASRGETLVVEDVRAFPGHIACDARSRSEIVVPVWAADGMLLGVLDVDSEVLGAFDETDKVWLEGIVGDVFGGVRTNCHQEGV